MLPRDDPAGMSDAAIAAELRDIDAELPRLRALDAEIAERHTCGGYGVVPFAMRDVRLECLLARHERLCAERAMRSWEAHSERTRALLQAAAEDHSAAARATAVESQPGTRLAT